MNMDLLIKIFGSLILFLIINLSNGGQNPHRMLCPSGYWPAEVNVSGGPYGTERTFELPYHPEMYNPICQFCPNVGCFIVRLSTWEEKKNTPRSHGKYPSSPSFHTITTFNPTNTIPTSSTGSHNDKSTIKSQSTINGTNGITDELNIPGSIHSSEIESDIKNQGEEYTQIYDTISDSTENEELYMSCDRWDNLPSPQDIVSYLDCVMIGEKEQFYLFIYEPRFREIRLPPVDCVDADFLSWIENGTELLGLELGFRMKTIPPFLFRYHQRIMQYTQYICIDGSSLINHSIPFEDAERFPSNKLTQVVFRNQSLLRERRPPQAPDIHYTIDFQSEEEIHACPFILQHKPVNITSSKDCQFSPGNLPTTSDKVSSARALERCPFRQLTAPKPEKVRRRKPHSGLVEELRVPPSFLSALLLVIVLLLTIGIIIAFCIMNHEKLMICRSRSSKKREREAALALEIAEQAAKEAAAAVAAEAEQQQAVVRHPIYGRFGMIPPNMGGAFGAFAPRSMDLPSYQTIPSNMGIPNNTMRPNPNYPSHINTNLRQ